MLNKYVVWFFTPIIFFDGKEAIKESYKSAEAFDENNLAVVSKKEDKYYLINNKGKKVSEQYVRIMYLGEKYYAGYTTGSKYEVFDVEGNKELMTILWTKGQPLCIMM